MLSPSHSPILPVYHRAEVQMQRGEGVYLYDTGGTQYLDFAAGIAVNALGHCHPHLVNALQEQTATLWHCSNLFHHQGLMRFSERITQICQLDSVFCCNSGAEAVEAAIKFARRYHDKTGSPERYRMIVAQGAFHGRTLATLSACQNPQAREGYAPFMDCYDVVAFNDVAALEAAITPETAAIMLEPIQGEGGIRPHTAAYLQKARQLCDERGLLLILDEIQCGMGRCGSLFAAQHYQIQPDMLLIGKGIGNGFPLAACLVNQAVATVMNVAGSHGSTFGGNPLAMAVGNAVLDVLLADGFMEKVQRLARMLQQELETLPRHYPHLFTELRGMGMLWGLETTVSAYQLTAKLRENNLIVAPAGDRVIRILPPLTLEAEHIQEAMDKIHRSVQNYQ
jgi:acetylornithine/N-succinyldiaminopimelate aminotransferase